MHCLYTENCDSRASIHVEAISRFCACWKTGMRCFRERYVIFLLARLTSTFICSLLYKAVQVPEYQHFLSGKLFCYLRYFLCPVFFTYRKALLQRSYDKGCCGLVSYWKMPCIQMPSMLRMGLQMKTAGKTSQSNTKEVKNLSPLVLRRY